MSERREEGSSGGVNAVELRIAGHPVRLSFAEEPDVTAAQRVRNCLIDSFLRQNREDSESA